MVSGSVMAVVAIFVNSVLGGVYCNTKPSGKYFDCGAKGIRGEFVDICGSYWCKNSCGPTYKETLCTAYHDPGQPATPDDPGDPIHGIPPKFGHPAEPPTWRLADCYCRGP
ncbi:unnamed protein product [Zymoseptoria tritici ST99CH_3D1]|nr:unnamed protein product [Zymoseptoria tritici ST99CH_3D1]